MLNKIKMCASVGGVKILPNVRVHKTFKRDAEEGQSLAHTSEILRTK